MLHTYLRINSMYLIYLRSSGVSHNNRASCQAFKCLTVKLVTYSFRVGPVVAKFGRHLGGCSVDISERCDDSNAPSRGWETSRDLPIRCTKSCTADTHIYICIYVCVYMYIYIYIYINKSFIIIWCCVGCFGWFPFLHLCTCQRNYSRNALTVKITTVLIYVSTLWFGLNAFPQQWTSA